LGGGRLTPAAAIVCVQSGPKLPETIVHLAPQPWAGARVGVLLWIYTKCVMGQDELAKRRISESPRQD
jgi:hypothetical protein